MNDSSDKKISTFSIPLKKLSSKKEKKDLKMGKHIVVRAKECCLTCGGTKRLRWVQKVDGTKVVKEVCLFCITTTHTAANRRDH